MIMDSFDDGSDILIKMIEISDKLDKAEIDERIFASNNATIDFFLSRSGRQLRRKLIHYIIYTFVKLIGKFLVDVVL